MVANINEQIELFIKCVGLGCVFGIYYDFFKSFRVVLKAKVLLSVIFDMLFWFCTSATLFVFLINFAVGENRGYIIFGVLLGILIYHFSLSRFIINIFVAIVSILCKILESPVCIAKKIIKKINKY